MVEEVLEGLVLVLYCYGLSLATGGGNSGRFLHDIVEHRGRGVSLKVVLDKVIVNIGGIYEAYIEDWFGL